MSTQQQESYLCIGLPNGPKGKRFKKTSVKRLAGRVKGELTINV